MKRKWMLGVLVATLACCILAPTHAMAASKAKTAIRRMSSSYTIRAAGGSVTLTGRLIYRKKVGSFGKTRTIDVPLTGKVSLLRVGSSYGAPRGVASQIATGSIFRFTVRRGDIYIVRFAGDAKRRPSEGWTRVYENVMSIKNLRCLESSRDAGGGLFVTMEADLRAPAGVVTTATPGGVIFAVARGTQNPFESLLGSILSSSDPFGSFDNAFLQMIRHSGPCRYGFSIPGSQADDVFSVATIFVSESPFVLPTSAVATFTPSDGLP